MNRAKPKFRARALSFALALLMTLAMLPMAGAAPSSNWSWENLYQRTQPGRFEMQNEYLEVAIGKYGEIYEIFITGDRYRTNYVMNSENSSYNATLTTVNENAVGQNRSSHQWMGELIFAWKYADEPDSAYREVDTNRSASLRRVEWANAEKTAVRVVYSVDNVAAFEARQSNPETYDKDLEVDELSRRIENFEVAITYKLEGGAFNWEISVKNTSDKDIVIGDIGLPMPFAERWTRTRVEDAFDGWSSPGQIYEERAIDHSFTGGDSAYIYATRPSGQGAILLFAPDVRTGARIEYQDHWIYTNASVTSAPTATDSRALYTVNEGYLPEIPERDGPLYQAWTQNSVPSNNGWNNGLNVFYIHSDMIKRTGRGYMESTKLELAPGASKAYGFNFFPVVGESQESDNQIAREEELRSILYQNDIIDAVAVPGMQIPTNMKGLLDLHTKADIKKLTLKCLHEDSPYKAPYIPQATNFQRGSASRPAFDLQTLNYNRLLEDCPKTDENTYVKFLYTKEIDGENHNVYEISMECLGQHNLYIDYEVGGAPKQTLLQFNSMAPVGDALQAHGDFMLNYTQVKDDTNVGYGAFDEWYFQSYNNTNTNVVKNQGKMNRFTNGEWGDDWGWPKGQFLAAKNFFEPDAAQIQALDDYQHNAIWRPQGTVPNYPNMFGGVWQRDAALVNTSNIVDGASGSVETSTLVDPETGKIGNLDTKDYWLFVDNFLGNGASATNTGTFDNRGYCYPHVWNTYFYLYKIAKAYPDMIDYRETAAEYLTRAYRIINTYARAAKIPAGGVTDRNAMSTGNSTPSYRWSGLMGESTVTEIREALLEEGYAYEAGQLDIFMVEKERRLDLQSYPYGSEYAYDNTGEEAVYEFFSYTDNPRRQAIDWKSRACRGIQPTWYYYGVAITITGENWWNFQYSMSLIGRCLDDWLRYGADDSDDWTPEERAIAQRVSYASKVGNVNCVNMGQIDPDSSNYGASAWSFQASKGVRGAKDNWLGANNIHGGSVMVNGWRNISGESELGLYGALRILSTDVITDPVFGLYGYGGNLTDNGSSYTVVPADGLYKRLNLLDERIYVEFERDQYREATIAKDGSHFDFKVKNLTKTAHDSRVNFFGLASGNYTISVDGKIVDFFSVASGAESVDVYIPVGEEEYSNVIIAPNAITVSSPVVKLVSGCDAYLDFYTNAEKVDVVDENGDVIVSGPATNGKARFFLQASQLTGESVSYYATVGGEVRARAEKVIPIVSQTGLWEAELGESSINFIAKVSFNRTKARLTVNGIPKGYSISEDELSILIADTVLNEGDKVVASGVKYYELFPSYSFTFTLTK